MSVIEITGLSKSYDNKVKAVDDLSLTIPGGMVFGILGPNGAGKSTIMNILAGIITRSGGEIRVLGEPIEKGDYEYKKQVGFVLEKPHYIKKLTVEEYLNFCGAMYGIEAGGVENRIAELLAFLDLLEARGHLIENLSKGMKKKVALAAALIHRPRLLLLDEPLEGIDPVSSKIIKDNLKQMTRKEMSVVISSHNLDTVEKFCDEIAIIDKGKRVFQEKTANIREVIKNDETGETFESLEEVFVTLISNNRNDESKKLSWLQ